MYQARDEKAQTLKEFLRGKEQQLATCGGKRKHPRNQFSLNRLHYQVIDKGQENWKQTKVMEAHYDPSSWYVSGGRGVIKQWEPGGSR